MTVVRWLAGFAGLLVAAVVSAGTVAAPAYPFPVADSYDATVIGTPQAWRASLPEKIPLRVYALHNRAPMPEVFWYNDALHFSAALQDHPAPMVFVIAGTGAAYNSAKMVDLQKALYQAGFHVINLSSPTYLNFQLSASSSHVPGYAPDDVHDLYRVMQEAYGKVKGRAEVTGFHIVGYSLGALHAAFIAERDQREKAFGLQKVYMINPPVSLYQSALILDRLTAENIPSENGMPHVGEFLDDVINELSQHYDPDQGMRFDSEFLYSTYKRNNGHGISRDKHTAAGLIGFAFRLTSGSMVFAADVMRHRGYIVPKDKVFGRYEPMDYYTRASHVVTFEDYVRDVLVPDVQARHPGLGRQQVIEASSLRAVAPFLAANPDVRVATNRDDLILAPGELDYLRHLMGSRMTVYPAGGHCGNINHATNVADMVAFLKKGQAL